MHWYDDKQLRIQKKIKFRELYFVQTIRVCDCKLSYCGAGLFGYIPYEMQTFDSVCCDLVKNSNIVTVFSTYINIICTRQQTGVILSLATLTPLTPLPILNLFLFFPCPSHNLSPSCLHHLREVWGTGDHSLHRGSKSPWFQNVPFGHDEQEPHLLERALASGLGGLGIQTSSIANFPVTLSKSLGLPVAQFSGLGGGR